MITKPEWITQNARLYPGKISNATRQTKTILVDGISAERAAHGQRHLQGLDLLLYNRMLQVPFKWILFDGIEYHCSNAEELTSSMHSLPPIE